MQRVILYFIDKNIKIDKHKNDCFLLNDVLGLK